MPGDDEKTPRAKKVAVWQRDGGSRTAARANRNGARIPTTTTISTTGTRSTTPRATPTPRSMRSGSPSINTARSRTPVNSFGRSTSSTPSHTGHTSAGRTASPSPSAKRHQPTMIPVAVKKRTPRIPRATIGRQMTSGASSKIPGNVRCMICADTTVWCAEENGNVSIREKDGTVFGMTQRGSGSPKIMCMLFVPGSYGSAKVLLGQANGTIMAVDAAKGERQSGDVKLHDGAVTVMSMLGNAGGIVTGGEDSSLHLLDPITMEQYGTLGSALGSVTAITCGGRKVFVGGSGGTIHVWDTSFTKTVGNLPLGSAVIDLVLSGRYLWVSTEMGGLHVVDALTLTCSAVLETGGRGPIRIVTCSNSLYAFQESGRVTVWNQQTLELMRAFNYGAPGGVGAMLRVVSVPEDIEIWTSNKQEGAISTWRDHDYVVPIWCVEAIDEARDITSDSKAELEVVRYEAQGKDAEFQARDDRICMLEASEEQLKGELTSLRLERGKATEVESDRRKRAETELGDIRAMMVQVYKQLHPEHTHQPHYGLADIRNMLATMMATASRATEAEQELSNTAAEVTALMASNAELSARLTDAQHKRAEHTDEEYHELEEQLRNAINRQLQQQEKAAEVEARYAAINDKDRAMNDKDRALRARENELNTSLRDIENRERDIYVRELDINEKEMDLRSTESRALTSLNSANTVLEDLRNENASLKEQVAALMQQIQEHEEVEELRTDVAVMMTELERQKSELFQEREKNQTLEEEKEQLLSNSNLHAEAAVASLREENEQYAAEMERLNTFVKEAGDALEKQKIIELERDQKVNEEMETVQQERREVEARLVRDKEAAAAEITTLNEKVNSLTEEIEKGKKGAIYEEKYAELEAAKAKGEEELLGEIANLKTKIGGMEVRGNVMEDEIREWKEGKERSEGRLRELELRCLELESASSANGNIEEDPALKERVTLLEDDKQRLKEMLEKLKAVQKKANEQLRAMGQQLEEKDRCISDLIAEQHT
eukprot:TRINITY_DN10486_c0_g2_i1.p1 TRINITY_DN10486_c0_g2~~TRINITY_DN10486_c0_g2_i1.p1  ORF type:complete len:1006 (+),score=288.38 TRINITY_DN10486_c0_g2_i1:33-3050(+)